MRTVRLGAALASLLAVAATAACTASATPATSTGATEPAVGTVPQLLDATALRMPVEDYLPTAEQSDRLGVARVRLIQKCLAGFGVAYPVTPVRGSDYGPRSDTERRYGITDAALARTAGYGLGDRDPARAGKPRQPDLDADGVTALSGSGKSVIDGRTVPEGGCVGQADRELAAPVPSGVDLGKAVSLQRWSFEKSRQDSRVTAVFRAWSQCMDRAGHSYADPMAVMADPEFESAAAGTREVTVALADIACKKETNVVGIWFTVESAYQRREIEADRAGFAAIRTALTARDVLAGDLA